MAKHPISRSGTSKFRMVVIDAELQDGEIGQLAQAIQGAFGGPRVTAIKVNGSAAKALPNPDSGDLVAEQDGAEAVEDGDPIEIVAAPPKQAASRKLRTPNLDNELHPEASPSFKVYAEARSVTSASTVQAKFLVVAAWLHEERSGMNVTGDRAYTCFRFIGWPFNIDFDQPLRNMKAKQKYLELKAENKGKGEYSITHLGLDRATKMKTAS